MALLGRIERLEAPSALTGKEKSFVDGAPKSSAVSPSIAPPRSLAHLGVISFY